MSPPPVLLHGFTGAPESWAEVRQRLEGRDDTRAPRPPDGAASPDSPDRGTGRFRPVLAPAGLGHDGTAGPPGIDRFEDEVDRLAAAIRQDDPRPRHLAGYSLGARVGLGLLVRHPALFRSATLIGANPGLTDPAEREDRAARDERWARLLETDGLDTFVAAWEALPLFATQEALPGDTLDRQRRIRRSHDPRGLARSLRVAGLARMPDYRSRLGDIDVPVRVIAGARDAKFRALASEMAERLPRAALTLVPDAGHNVVLERPTEIAALLREDMA